jgi:hypothetical protein
MVTFMVMVRPFILRLQGVRALAPRAFTLRADFDWPRPDVRMEFLRARTNDAGGVELHPNQGSGVVTSLVWGDGLIWNPPAQAIARGDMKTEAEAYREGRYGGWLSANEIRGKQGLNPIENAEVGDRYWQPVNMVDAAAPAPTQGSIEGPTESEA